MLRETRQNMYKCCHLIGYILPEKSTTCVRVKNILESIIDTYVSPLSYIERNARMERKRDSRDVESTSSCGEIFFENQLV